MLALGYPWCCCPWHNAPRSPSPHGCQYHNANLGTGSRGIARLWAQLGSCCVPSAGRARARAQVLRNDVLCHARTVQAVSEAGQGLLLGGLGDGEEGLRKGLQQLRQRWDLVLSQTESRQLELENNLSQVRARRGHHGVAGVLSQPWHQAHYSATGALCPSWCHHGTEPTVVLSSPQYYYGTEPTVVPL